MAVENVSIQFNINNSVLTSAITKVNKLKQTTESLTSSIKELRNAMNGLSNVNLNINGLNNIRNQSNNATAGMTKAQKAALNLYQDLFKVGKIRLDQIPAEFREIINAEHQTDVATAKLYAEMLKLKQINYSDIPEQFRRILRTTEETRQEMLRADQAATRLYQNLYRTGRISLDRIPEELREVATRATIAQRALQAMSRVKMSAISAGLAGVGQNLMQVGRTMSMYVTAPIVAGLALSSKASADFEQQIANTGAVADATAKQMGRLKNQALDLGLKTKFSALEVAKGQTELLKAGRNINQVFKEMKPVLDLAAAGDISVAKASEYTANMLNMFHKEGITATNVANLFAGAANQSAIDATDFYNTMKYVGGGAAAMNIPLKEVAGIVAVLGNNAKKGTSAGTGLRQILARLQPASDKAEAAMKKLGLVTSDGGNKFYDAEGKLKPFVQIIDTLRGSLKGMTDKDMAYNLDVIFGKVASPSVYALISKNGDALQKMGERIMDISSADVAARKLDTFSGSLEFMKSSIETFSIKIGDSLNPALRLLAKTLSKVFDALYKLPNGAIGGIVAFSGLLAAIGPIVLIMGMFTIAISALLTPIGLVTTAIGLLIGVGALGGLVTMLSGYVGGGEGLKKSLQGIKDKASEIYKYLSSQWLPGIKFLLSGDKKTLAKIDDKEFQDSLVATRKSITELSKTLSETIKTINTSMGNINKQDLDDLSKIIISSVKGLADVAKTVLQIIKTIKEAYDWLKKIGLKYEVAVAGNSMANKSEEKSGAKAEIELEAIKMQELSNKKQTYTKSFKVATTFEGQEAARANIKRIDKELNDTAKSILSKEKKYNKKYKASINVDNTMAIAALKTSNKKIDAEAKKNTPSYLKHMTFKASVNHYPATTTISNSNSILRKKANEKIPDPTKYMNVGASVGIGRAINSIQAAMNSIVSYARNTYIPDIQKHINIVTNTSVVNKSSGSKKKYASGTRYAEGGMALVGEHGAELVNMTRGSQVYNNQQTRNMLNNSSSKNVNINYSGKVGTDDKNRLTNMLRMAGVY